MNVTILQWKHKRIPWHRELRECNPLYSVFFVPGSFLKEEDINSQHKTYFQGWKLLVITQVDGRCALHLASLHPYKTPFVLTSGFLRRTQSEPLIVVQNRHRASAYFGSAVQVQRKSSLSTALLMCSPPTWAACPRQVKIVVDK